jgi:hypothetical protein
VKPIRLRRDAVLHTVHTSPTKFTVASGAEAARSIANPNGFGWPSCMGLHAEAHGRAEEAAPSSDASAKPRSFAVEEYLIVDQRPENEEDLRAKLHAWQSGRSRLRRHDQVLTMPKTWSEVKKRHKRAALIFFVELVRGAGRRQPRSVMNLRGARRLRQRARREILRSTRERCPRNTCAFARAARGASS